VRERKGGRTGPICAAVPVQTRDMSQALSLDNIRSSLIRQEDTIIFSFIERAQFARNEAVYTPDRIPVPGRRCVPQSQPCLSLRGMNLNQLFFPHAGFDRSGQRYSLLQYVLRETEQLHAKLRRYTSPDEHPFFPDDLPPLVCMDDVFHAQLKRRQFS
jgi:chorismate mutase